MQLLKIGTRRRELISQYIQSSGRLSLFKQLKIFLLADEEFGFL